MPKSSSLLSNASRCNLLTGLIVALFCQTTKAQVFDERFEDWPLKTTVAGRVIVADTLNDLVPVDMLMNERDRAGKIVLLCPQEQEELLVRAYKELVRDVEVIPEPQAALDLDLETFDLIAWHTRPFYATAQGSHFTHRQLFRKCLDAGKTCIVIGRQAEWCGQVFFESDEMRPRIQDGADLLFDCILSLNFDRPSSRASVNKQQRLLSHLVLNPRQVGLGLDANTALMLSGRKCLVAGDGGATFLIAGNGRQPYRMERIIPRQQSNSVVRLRTTDWLADLTEWRRDAIDRTLEPFPAQNPMTPNVKNGTLFIVGGGGMPRDLMNQFVEAAGGVEKARLVYVPCSESPTVSEEQSIVEAWKRMGIENATFIHTKDRNQANEDDAFLEPLRNATGVWFGGGRQWNFADSYYGTTAHRLMKEVVIRGGAIGGSSAGASIQARYLARATPIENFRIMAPGYERGGLGFLSGVAIDQHFTQRRRQRDMTQLVNRYPQMLGIGIDEATAIIVRGSIAEVTGRGKVHFYDRNLPVYPDRKDFTALSAGQKYDLSERKVVSE